MTSEMQLRRTPLFHVHVEEGAKIVAFAGWEMPVQYQSIIAEHAAVRGAAGIFDVSHMGRLRVTGPGALASVQLAVTSDVSKLEAGQCVYSLLLTEDAGIADDLFVYSPSGRDDELTLVVNAVNTDKDLAMIRACMSDAKLADETPTTAMIALQGPKAEAMLAPLTDLDLGSLKLHRFAVGTVAGTEATVSRTGYTGEDGFEIVTRAEDGPTLWRALRAAGAVSCGLGARDVLRLEAAYPLWGHEIDNDTRPSDVGAARFCSAEKGDYVGRAAHEAYAAAGPLKCLVGLRMTAKRIAREDAEVRVSGAAEGRVTSGTYSPVLGCGIALAHVANPHRKPIRERRAELAGRAAVCVTGSVEVPALFVDLPFYRRGQLH